MDSPHWRAACDKDSSGTCTASVGSAGCLGHAWQGAAAVTLPFTAASSARMAAFLISTSLSSPQEQAPQPESKRAPGVHIAAFMRCRQSPDLHKAPCVTPGLRSVDF